MMVGIPNLAESVEVASTIVSADGLAVFQTPTRNPVLIEKYFVGKMTRKGAMPKEEYKVKVNGVKLESIADFFGGRH